MVISAELPCVRSPGPTCPSHLADNGTSPFRVVGEASFLNIVVLISNGKFFFLCEKIEMFYFPGGNF